MGTTNSAKINVFRSDFQNVSLWNRRVKLSKPINSIGCGETSRALVNASVNVSAMGTMTKVTRRTNAGATIHAPTTFWDRPGRADLRSRRLRAAGGTGGLNATD